MKKLISSVMPGIYIGLGATTYLMSDNKFAGCFLFCVGIFLVISYYNMLYTKIVPNIPFKKYAISDMGIALIGNLIGGIFYAFLISQTRLADQISDKITVMINTKLNDSYISIFIMAIFCAVLVTYAIFSDRVYPDNKLVSVILSFLFIMAFVMCGFDHVVANMFYYSFYSINNGFKASILPSFLVILAGNTFGGFTIGYLEKYRLRN